MTSEPTIGLSLYSRPERIAAEAAAAEEAGFDEVWLGEDFFDTGGITAAALALGATSRVVVGLGVLSAAVRQPALLAMELAALGRAHSGRFIAGIGLGDPEPLRVIGASPASPLSLIRESVSTIRALLRGERIGGRGGEVALAYPVPIPIHIGAVGPRMLRLAGETGDGTVLSTGTGPAYVEWARRRLAEGRGGSLDGHRVTALTFISAADTTETAREAIQGPLARLLAKPVFRPVVRYSGLGSAAEQAAGGDPEELRAVLGPEWIDAFAVAGDPPACVARIRALHAAGADAVILCPWGGAPGCAGLVSTEVLGALRPAGPR
jgi:alkanesulfonate monooxygenase SsuD/methylene tetrahydromethanopterin reductase-like flavin-dependent oxidoreductase (luciferase family)